MGDAAEAVLRLDGRVPATTRGGGLQHGVHAWRRGRRAGGRARGGAAGACVEEARERAEEPCEERWKKSEAEGVLE